MHSSCSYDQLIQIYSLYHLWKCLFGQNKQKFICSNLVYPMNACNEWSRCLCKARGIKTCSLCIAPNNKCPKIFFSFQPIKFTLLNQISCTQSFSFTNVRYVSILRPLHFNTCQIDCCLSNNYWKLLFYHISFQPLKILHTSFNHTERPSKRYHIFIKYELSQTKFLIASSCPRTRFSKIFWYTILQQHLLKRIRTSYQYLCSKNW